MKPVKPQASMTSAEKSFWQKYTEFLRQYNIFGKSAEYTLYYAQQFTYSLTGKKLNQVTASDIAVYLNALDRNDNIKNWQFSKVILALQILFKEMVRTKWTFTFNWQECLNTYCAANSLYANDSRVESSYTKPTLHSETLKAIARLREIIRIRNMSIRTEKSYSDWVKRLAYFCNGTMPQSPTRVRDFLEYLALELKVAPATQSVALNAIAFFYKEVLQQELGDLGAYQRPKCQRNLPVVLTTNEIQLLLQQMDGTFGLMARLIYGTGMRLMECIRLRVKDIDFGNQYILVLFGKGGKHRRVPLPQRYQKELIAHLEMVKLQFDRDVAAGFGAVYIPDALSRKYSNAASQWSWRYVFPSARISTDPRSGQRMRHHIHENGLQKAIKKAAQKAGIVKTVNCHSLRHSFATHLLEANYDIRTIQELLGHADVATTMIYTHVMNRPGVAARSPADLLPTD